MDLLRQQPRSVLVFVACVGIAVVMVLGGRHAPRTAPVSTALRTTSGTLTADAVPTRVAAPVLYTRVAATSPPIRKAAVDSSLRSDGPGGSAGFVVRVPHDLSVTSAAGAGPVVGAVNATSANLHQPTFAWIQRVSADGAYGLVAVPYVWPHRTGWVRLTGLARSQQRYWIRVTKSTHTLDVLSGTAVVEHFTAGIGADDSTTPDGRYWISDLVADPGGAYGSYIFGLDGVQPHPPAGWSGAAQLAIHGTDNGTTIGASASAGCVHLTAAALRALRRVVGRGTPVIVRP